MKHMRKLFTVIALIVALACVSPIQCSATRLQERIPADKVEHCGVSYVLMDATDNCAHWNVWEKRLFVLGIGVAKECSDPVFDKNDLAADALGIALHELVHYKITW